MKNQKKAYDFKKECRLFAIVMTIVLALIMLAGILDICGVFYKPEEPEWKPTVIYPMANAKISWLETHHPGPWGVSSHGD